MSNGGSQGADQWGITDGYHGTDGTWHQTSDDTRAALRAAMAAAGGAGDPAGMPPSWVVPEGWGESLRDPCHLVLESGLDEGVIQDLSPDLPIGRHQLIPVDGGPATRLIIRPRRCHHPRDLRAAALAVQVYAARSERSWGIGDLRDLRTLGGWAARQGVDLLGISPLHAPTPAEHPQPSPYYPSSRRHLNPLHICIDEVPGAGDDERIRDLADEARALNAERRIDRSAVWAAKSEALQRLFDRRLTADRAFDDFCAAGGEDLQQWATFCAIAETHPGSWRDWPTELQHPGTPGVARFARDHEDRITFPSWLQCLADRQLRDAGVECPLICDLAVGVDPGGADAWMDQDILALGARVGAPPDDFSADGQDWGLPPYVPHAQRATGYETFARNLRANLRYGAGIRIDHILGLFRLFWVPEGESPSHGAYVRQHAEELLAVLAIESVRAGAFVVGEDLGTVEKGVRESLAANGVLSTRLVIFEDEPPAAWPPNVLGGITTHDLPTVAGLWTGADARARAEAGLPSEDHSKSRAAIARLAPEDADAAQAVEAAHRALAQSPAEVVLGTIDDVLVVDERPNMPGTTDEWPNWSIALPTTLDELVAGAVPPTLRALTER